MFDSIDVEQKGVITPAQLAGDMGISNLEELGFQGKTELTFEDFVKILRRAETGRAGRTMAELLHEKEQGQSLANASQQKRVPVPAGPGRLGLPALPEVFNHLMITKLCSHSQRRSFMFNFPCKMGNLSQLGILNEIWQEAKPEGTVANIENIKAALISASNDNSIRISDDDLMQIIFSLASLADANQNISFADFVLELKPLVDSGNNFDSEQEEEESPRLRVGGGIIPDDEDDDEWAVSEMLSENEFDEMKAIFDGNDRDGDGLVPVMDLKQYFMTLMSGPMIQPSARVFYMQVPEILDSYQSCSQLMAYIFPHHRR